MSSTHAYEMPLVFLPFFFFLLLCTCNLIGSIHSPITRTSTIFCSFLFFFLHFYKRLHQTNDAGGRLFLSFAMVSLLQGYFWASHKSLQIYNWCEDVRL